MNRTGWCVAGTTLLIAAWVWPLPSLGAPPFSEHMAMHMIVVAIVAPLLAMGLRGGAFDPVRRAPQPFSPILASIAELLAVWAWHAPALHHAARSRLPALIAEQGTFLVAGGYLWMSVLGGTPRQRRERTGSSVIGLLLTSMHMTLLGALIALADRPLYGHAHHAGALTVLQDQQLGGAIMIFVGGLAYLTGGVCLMAVAWLSDPSVGERT